MKLTGWIEVPELEIAIKKLEEVNKELKENGDGEIIMPYIRRIPKNRVENLAKGRKAFQKAMGYNVP